jgi:hypothetical protein
MICGPVVDHMKLIAFSTWERCTKRSRQAVCMREDLEKERFYEQTCQDVVEG